MDGNANKTIVKMNRITSKIERYKEEKKKKKGEEEGKRRKRKRNQVTLITNYCYIISYFSYRGSSQNVCDVSQ